VPVEKTRQEMEELLRRHGATQYLQASDHEPKKGETSSVVQFKMGDRMVRLRFGVPVKPQEARRKWRMILMIVKAKLEFVADGGSTIEREFLADVLLPDGQTAGEWFAPQLKESYNTGGMPPLLAAPSAPQLKAKSRE
jgi:hypothetical protein